MKSYIVLLLLISSICFVFAGEKELMDFNNAENLSGFIKSNSNGRTDNHCYEIYGRYPTELIYKDMIKIDANKTYVLSCYLRSLDEKLLASGYMGFRLYDKNKRFISLNTVRYIPNTDTSLFEKANKGDRVVKVIPNGAIKDKIAAVIAFNAKEDLSDLPNFDISSAIQSVTNKGEYLEITLKDGLKKDYSKGTSIRLHSPWCVPMYNLGEGWVPANKWTFFSATLKNYETMNALRSGFFKGTVYARPFIWFGNWNRLPKAGAKLLVDDFSFVEKD